jgi:antitoxin YefM
MAVSASAARADLFNLIDRVNDDQDTVEITTRRGSAFLVPEATYHSMVETLHLMRSRTNARRLLDSLDELDRNDVVEHREIDLDDDGEPQPAPQILLENIRTWARDSGMTVSERGRISPTVQEAYLDAHGIVGGNKVVSGIRVMDSGSRVRP